MGRKRLLLLVCVCVVGWLGGCSGRQGTPSRWGHTEGPLRSSEGAIKELRTLGRVMLLPPLFGTEARDASGRREEVYDLFTTTAQRELALEHTTLTVEELRVFPLGGTQWWDQGVKAARRAGAPGVLVVTVNGLVERIGSRVGAERGAVLDLEVALKEVPGGRVIWTSSYHFTDAAVSDNLLALGDRKDRPGNGWVTTRQLLGSAFARALRDLEQQRLAAFSAQE